MLQLDGPQVINVRRRYRRRHDSVDTLAYLHLQGPRARSEIGIDFGSGSHEDAGSTVDWADRFGRWCAQVMMCSVMGDWAGKDALKGRHDIRGKSLIWGRLGYAAFAWGQGRVSRCGVGAGIRYGFTGADPASFMRLMADPRLVCIWKACTECLFPQCLKQAE